MWNMFGNTYMVVNGVEITSRNTDLSNIESYLFVYFT